MIPVCASLRPAYCVASMGSKPRNICICFVRFAFLLDVAAHHEDRQERQDKGHHEFFLVIGGGHREQNARYGASEGPSHALCRGVPSKRRGDHLLATVLGKKRVEGWITH